MLEVYPNWNLENPLTIVWLLRETAIGWFCWEFPWLVLGCGGAIPSGSRSASRALKYILDAPARNIAFLLHTYGRRWRDCQVVESQPNDSWTRERQSQRRFRYIFYFDLMAILHRASWSRTMSFKWTFKDSVNYMPTMEWLSKFKNVSSGNMKFLIWYTYSRNRLNFYTTSRTNPADQIFIFFSEERSVGVKTMRK